MDWNGLIRLSAAKTTLLRKLKLRKHRHDLGLFVAEGVRLVEEAVRHDAAIEWAVAAESDDSRTNELADSLMDRCDLFRTDKRSLSSLLDSSSPQGIAAVCRIPECKPDNLHISEKSLLVICDSMRDPGNLGAIARTASAAGATALIAAGQGVDPWNPKAVRGSMGGVFGLPVIEDISPGELKSFLAGYGFSVYLADMAGENVFELDAFPARSALIIGGEAGGAGEFSSDLESARLAIPMAGGAESLNAAVAAGILIYQIMPRQGGRRAN